MSKQKKSFIISFFFNRSIAVLLISALAFLAFYWNAYFSPDFKGMLGYETKDTLTELKAYFNAIDQGASIFWDSYYLYYTPTWPQAPIYSPVTILFLFLHKLSVFSNPKVFFIFYLVILAIIQVLCAYTMYLFLRWCSLNFMPSVLGGLAYAYNHQTFVFGIRHGYERISAIMIAPLFLLYFFKFLDSSSSGAKYRKYAALAALLFGLSLICNGDVKPTLFFALFMVFAAVLKRPFLLKNILILLLIFVLGGGLFLVQGLLTGYAYGYTLRSHESMDTILEYSLRPLKLLLTHISTSFTDRPDYPWENTVEFSLSFLLLAILGIFHLRRHRLGLLFAVTLIFCYVWILGRHTPLAPLVGFINYILAMHIPTRMAMLLYFCYAFLIATGVQYLSVCKYDRFVVACLFAVPAGVLILFLTGYSEIPARYVVFVFLSYSVLFLVTFGAIQRRFLWLIALFFMLERTTIFSTLEESNVCDPTKFYTYDEIYRAHPRVEAILKDPAHQEYRAFFGIKDFPDLFSHNFYLNAFGDGIRPLFAYFYLDHQWYPVSRIKDIILKDWSHPMWNLLNVKYFVDLHRYVDLDTERVVSRGLEKLRPVDPHLRINPAAEKELFVRYQSELIKDDESFLNNLRRNKLDLERVAYVNRRNEERLIKEVAGETEGEEKVEIISRKPDEIVAEVTVPRKALVIFSEFWFFPWQAEVNDKKADLFRAYNVLQGVKIPPGCHRVRFYFNSRHWKFVLPFIISYSLILLLVIYILYWRYLDKIFNRKNFR